MLFPTHLVAAVLLERQWRLSVPLVVLGAALPDVVDKPAAMLGVVDLFHSVGHSLSALVVVAVLASRYRRLVPLCVGWASHLALDALHMVLNGRPADVQFLAWPLVRHTPAVNLPPLAFAAQYVGTPSFYIELLIWLAFGYVLVTSRRISDDGR
jgi:hypothetical protein